MNIIRLIVGAVVTLKHPGVKKMVEKVEKAEADFKKSINAGMLMKGAKELQASAQDADVVLKKYITFKEVEKDGKKEVVFTTTKKFRADLMPFLYPQELAELIARALRGEATSWTDYDKSLPEVIEHAKARRPGQNMFASDRPQVHPMPWEKLGASAGALNWAWALTVQAVKDGQDPAEVEATTRQRLEAVAKNLGSLEKIRTRDAVVGLRSLLKETRDSISTKSNEREVMSFFQQEQVLDNDLARGGQGRGPSIGSRLDQAEKKLSDLTSPTSNYGGRLTEPGQA